MRARGINSADGGPEASMSLLAGDGAHTLSRLACLQLGILCFGSQMEHASRERHSGACRASRSSGWEAGRTRYSSL